MNTYHLLPDGPGWKLTLEGFEDPVETYPASSKIEALGKSCDMLREMEEPASLRVHREDGSFEEERTYPRSADPVLSPG